MSTKAIREALGWMVQHAHQPGIPFPSAAIAELEAIEKAAKDLHRGMHGRGWDESGVNEGFALIEAIAKELS